MKSLLILALSLSLSGCIIFAGENFYDQATINESEKFYTVTLRGERTLHPASGSEWFFPKKSKQTYTLQLPKRIGKIEGKEMPRREGLTKFTGMIELTKEYVLFDLQLDNQEKDDWTWNGKYSLNENK